VNDKYVLDSDGNPVREPSLLKWALWFEHADRQVALDVFAQGHRVSTVFLGLNHSFGSGPPVLWETMVFNDYGDIACERYTSREDALAGHQRAIEELERRLAVQP
jgi:hypothetical protein